MQPTCVYRSWVLHSIQLMNRWLSCLNKAWALACVLLLEKLLFGLHHLSKTVHLPSCKFALTCTKTSITHPWLGCVQLRFIPKPSSFCIIWLIKNIPCSICTVSTHQYLVFYLTWSQLFTDYCATNTNRQQKKILIPSQLLNKHTIVNIRERKHTNSIKKLSNIGLLALLSFAEPRGFIYSE